MAQTTIVIIRTCPLCDETREIEVDAVAYHDYLRGVLLQNAFPNLTPGQREEIKSGYHEDCFDRLLFSDDE